MEVFWPVALISQTFFTLKSLFQTGAKDMSKMVNMVNDFLS